MSRWGRRVVVVAAGMAAMALPAAGAVAAPRPGSVPGQAAAVSPAAITAAFSGPAAGPADGTAQPEPGSGAFTLGQDGWQVVSSATAGQGGHAISLPGYQAGNWLPVKPDDAGAPETEIEALLQNGACPDVFYSNNMQKCFGYESQVGKETVPRFAVPWWFRTDFQPGVRPGQYATLTVNGVVGEADVWVNGTEVATKATVQGDYTRYTFDVTKLLRRGANVLAIEVYPNNPNTMYTLDDVDWNQIPPDNNTGIQFPVTLHVADALALSDAHVLQDNAAGVSRLTVQADVTNGTAQTQQGTVRAVITPPGGSGTAVRVSEPVTVPAGKTETVSLTPQQYPQLVISHPRLWWPYQMGGQPLYTLRTAVIPRHGAPDTASETFGIRTITSRLTGPSPAAPNGSRQFAVNGVPFVFRGGGFAEDIFLRYSAADAASQIALLKGMGLNGIRLEGHIMPEDFYQQMDRAGIMIDAGFQCCDAWQLPTDGKGVTAHDYSLLRLSALTIGQRLRNHPSVISFSWSDNQPIPQQEKVSLAGFQQAGFQDPVISSAEYNSSKILGPSGEKEGPYDWVPPSYWYDTTHYDPTDPTRTNVGGAWAFDSEESAGDTVSTLSTLQQFLSPSELTELWKNPAYHQYHANYETGHNGYEFGSLYNLDQAVAKRYGSWHSLAQYAEEAQVQNYEDTRSQFEAFIDHSTNSSAPSTGTVYWQANKGWPSLLWLLYNSNYDEAGSYFGTEQANQAVHALYSYDSRTVTVDNLTGQAESGLSVQATVYNLAGQVLSRQTAGGISLAAQGVRNDVLAPRVPAATKPPAAAKTYFVELTLRQHGAVVDHNVYWLSTQPDQVNWKATEGNPQATMTQYANMQALQGLPAAAVRVTAASSAGQGAPAGSTVVTVTVRNTSDRPVVGFFLRADVCQDDGHGGAGAVVRPAVWSDNDITLWPGESQTLTATVPTADLGGAAPVVTLSGWNVPGVTAAAPATAAAQAAEQAAGGQPGAGNLGFEDGSPAQA
jgi:exo-1,4-beta-D-glucosaminidase